MRLLRQLQLNSQATLRYAVKVGNIIKPSLCERCEKRRKLLGHHSNYLRPLAVEWLCLTCHSKHHRGRLGINAGWPDSWYNFDDNCLDTQADIDGDRNSAFDRYSHDLEINPTIFGRLHNYA